MPINLARIRLRQLMAAEGYLELTMPDHALREIESIDESGGQCYQTLMLRGEAWLLKEDQQRALDAFRLAHIENSTDLMALMRMAWCFKRTDQLPLAIETMKLA